MGIGKIRAQAFTIDAIIALLIILAMIPIVDLLTTRTPTTQTATSALHLEAGDVIDVLSKTMIRDVRDEPVIDEMFNRIPPALTDDDLNLTVLDILGSLWASQDPAGLQDAANITRELLGDLVPSGLKWSFSINGTDVIYNSSFMNGTQIVAVSRKAASGFARNQNSTGYVARAFLENILGKEDNSYFFFGGFVGEGNLTATISDIPINSTVSKIYLELNSQSNFTLCLNGNNSNCKLLNVSGGNFTVDNWSILSTEPIIGDFIPGDMNNFTFLFQSSNLTQHYIGGGYLRVTYTTDQIIQYTNNTAFYHFPGIDGLLNLYDSFYVPGNITSMNAFIRLYSFFNYTTLGFIGNTTFLNHTGNNITEDITISNASLSAIFAANNISFIDLSQLTIPLRMLTGANITGGKLNGTADVVLITDVSGSMDWQMDSDNSGTDLTNCDNPNVFNDPNTARISVARCLDKVFINAILGGNASVCGAGTPLYGNRVALVNFSDSVRHNTSLQNGGTANLTYLTSMINGYNPNGGTCVACAINRAYEILMTQSPPERQKYVVVMTDGVANYRATGSSDNINGIGASNTASFSSLVVQDGGNTSRSTESEWKFLTTASSNNLNTISMLNSTFAFAGSSNGEFYYWDGTSWSLSNNTGLGAIYSIDIWNESLAFAGGTSGRIHWYNGSNWGLMADTGSQEWYAITAANGSWAMAGSTGGVIYRWDGSGWAAYSTFAGGNTIFSLDAFNSSLALAGTSSEEIFRWSVGSTWTEDYDSGSSDITGISFLNGSLAFAVTVNGEIIRWVPNSASNSFTLPGTDRLNSITILNSSAGYAAGDNARIALWNGNAWNVSASLTHAFEGNGTTGNSPNDNSYDTCGIFFNQSYASMNANYSSGRLYSAIPNTTIDSVGFGPITNCMQANQTLFAIAQSGNGTFYASSNATELQSIYCQIAFNINTKKTQTQEITFSGNLTRTTLYPESFIQFQYIPAVPESGYKEVEVTTETDTFPNCTGSFFIPLVSRIVDAKMTSYSGNYWTSGAYVNSSATSGYENVYNLSNFDLPFTDLGDPFHAYLPVSLLRTNESNQVRNELGLNRSLMINNCSAFNRVIYKARLKASTSYGNIFQTLIGKNVMVYYDNNHDGIQDGFTFVAFGVDLPLCGGGISNNCFDPTPVDIASLSSCSSMDGDAMDCAIQSLLAQLNYVVMPANTGLAGESTNPIDIIIGGEVNVQTNSLQLVPIPWGPVDMMISVWV